MLVAGLLVVMLLLLPIFSPVGTLAWKEGYIDRVLGFIIDEPEDLTFDFHNQLKRPDELVVLSQVFETLGTDEKVDCVILADGYDIASNVLIHGDAYGLPVVISGSNSFYHWGTHGVIGGCVLVVGYEEDILRGHFKEIQFIQKSPSRYINQPERGRDIFLCREPYRDLETVWPDFKRFR